MTDVARNLMRDIEIWHEDGGRLNCDHVHDMIAAALSRAREDASGAWVDVGSVREVVAELRAGLDSLDHYLTPAPDAAIRAQAPAPEPTSIESANKDKVAWALTPEREAEIRARVAAEPTATENCCVRCNDLMLLEPDFDPSTLCHHCAQDSYAEDVPLLLAEIDRLRAKLAKVGGDAS